MLVTADKEVHWAWSGSLRLQAMFRHWSQAVTHRATWLPEELKGPKRKRVRTEQNGPGRKPRHSGLKRLNRAEKARQTVSAEEDPKTEEDPNIDSAGDAPKTEEAFRPHQPHPAILFGIHFRAA